jgi:hypothetical protein
MMNKIDNVKNTVSMIVSRYRNGKSLREFANDLSSQIPQPISHQTIKNWEDRIFLPEYYPILAVAMNYDDWRRQFALEILAAIRPEQYAPDSPMTLVKP